MSTLALLLLLRLLEPTPTAPVESPTECAPPLKQTITVPCEPHEPCTEKWIFVDKRTPVS